MIGNFQFENLWIATGTYRDGVQLSPEIAKLISNGILKNEALPCTFNPERKLKFNSSVDKAIEKFVSQYSSVATEHNTQLPFLHWSEFLNTTYRARAQKIHEILEIDFGLPVDIQIMLMHNPDYLPKLKMYFAKKDQLNEVAA